MPFAPRIRKEILKALDESIIPALWKQQVPLGYVTPPLLFPPNIQCDLVNSRLPRRDAKSPSFPIQASWKNAKLHSTAHTYLSFIYEGVANERTLITAAQASQYKIRKGIYTVQWQAPGVLFFPAGVSRNSGARRFFQENPNPHFSTLKILQLAFRDKILIHTHTELVSEVEASHSLQINDASLLALAGLFQEELQNALTIHQETAQAMLLTIMLRLRHQLASHPPSLANTAHPQTIESALPGKNTQDFCQKTIHFIQTHLHEPLSLPMIAQEIEISPTHLNRLFRQFSGIPVMRYVKLQRIAAAKTILEAGTENIAEIAALVGFGSSTVFCRVFLHETGLTPNNFRRQSKHSKSTF